nr:ribonuclease H-like domain-containing protein [Tanacetum cinerariifolium]
MDQDSAHVMAASKVPMLKPGEYELWRMRMEQYIQMVDYSLWEVIENGNAPIITQVVEGVETTIAATTAQKMTQRRLQKLISLLEIHGESISQEDVNQKFLRSLSPAWNTHIIVWRNKPEIDTLSFTSSINEAVNTTNGVTTASTQATAVNSTKIDNLSDAIICYFFASQPNIPQLNNENLQQIHPDDLKEMDLRWQMDMLTIRTRRFLKNTGGKFYLNRNETIRTVPVETPASAALISYDGLGGYVRVTKLKKIIDKCKISLGYNVVLPPYTGNFLPPKPDLSGLEEFVNEPIVSKPTVKKPVVETSEAKASIDKSKVIKKNFGPPLIEDWISDIEDEAELKSKIEKETVKPSFAKIKFVKSKEQVKSPRKTTVKQGNQNRLNTHNPRGNQRNWNNMMSQRLKSNFEMYNKSCYVSGSFDHLQANCNYYQQLFKNQKMGNPQMDFQDKGLFDSGCTRHMTRNMSYLTYYEEIDGGYVAFGGNPKEGKITSRGIMRQYSVARTPQQNRVAERRNKTLIEASRTMLANLKLPTMFWAEAVNAAC